MIERDGEERMCSASSLEDLFCRLQTFSSLFFLSPDLDSFSTPTDWELRPPSTDSKQPVSLPVQPRYVLSH